MNLMQEHVNTELVRFAVQTAITCPGCKHILDVEDAVLVTHKTSEKTAVACGACWDRDKSKLSPAMLAALDVIDTRPPLPVVAPVKGKRGTVALTFKDGKRDAPATIYGPLAIHAHGTRASRYTITHIATGYIVASDLRLGPARQLVAALQPLDWSFTDPNAVPRATREQAVGIIRPFIRLRLGRNIA